MSFRLLATGLVFVACAALRLAPLSAGEAVDALEGTTPEVRAADLRHHLDFLCADACQGRDSCEPGCQRAAEYVAGSFARSGLSPKGDAGTWFQGFAIPRAVLGPSNLLEATTPEGAATFALGDDWNPLSVSPRAKAEGDLVFAGVGITDP
jgi:hypothetical protein